MIVTTNIEQAKTQIKNSREKIIVVQAHDDDFNRKILEYGKFDILLFSSSLLKKKDKLKQLDSGINHVLANIAAKNKVAIGFDLSSLQKMEKKEKAIVLAKIMQNVRLCKKAKTNIKILNYRNSKNALNLMLSLGASTAQAKNAI